MNKVKNVLFIFLFIVLSVSSFANGGDEEGTSTSGGTTQITFMTPLAGADGAVMDQIIQGFNDSNPDVEITHLVVGDSVEYKQKLSTGLATDSAPEVLLIRKFDMPSYMDLLTGFTKSEYSDFGIDINDVFPNLLEGLDYDGKTVGIPLDVWVFYSAYNKANFAKAGVDPDNFPMDRESFIETMKKVAAVSPEGIQPYYENMAWTWIWCNFLWQFGGDLLTDDFKKPAFMDAGVDVCNFILELQEEGICPPGAVDPGPAMESGESSLLITGIWTINPWKDLFGDDFGYAVAPQLGNTNAVFGGSHVISVVDTMTQDPAKKDAAMRWVKYLWDHMFDWYFAGQTPSRKSIAESDELKEQLPHIYAVAQQNNFVKSFQMFPLISEVQGELAIYIEAALYTKEMTPEEAMDAAAEAVQYILDDYWMSH